MRGSQSGKDKTEKKPPLFMVARKQYNGKEEILMWTDDKECVYDADIIQSIVQAGCTVYFSGEKYEPKKVRKKK